jgi:hypothetical protein
MENSNTRPTRYFKKTISSLKLKHLGIKHFVAVFFTQILCRVKHQGVGIPKLRA